MDFDGGMLLAGAEQHAAQVGMRPQNSAARSGPSTYSAVASASAWAAVGAIAVAERTPAAGQPVRGSRMCPYRRPW